MERPYRDKAEGWRTFAGIMLFLVGALHFAQGLVMISGDEIFADGPDEAAVVIGDVTTWGWIILIIGILEALAGVGVFSRNQLARWIGVASAGLGLLAQFGVFFGGQSSFSFLVALLCTLVIYGLVLYGGEEDSPA